MKRDNIIGIVNNYKFLKGNIFSAFKKVFFEYIDKEKELMPDIAYTDSNELEFELCLLDQTILAKCFLAVRQSKPLGRISFERLTEDKNDNEPISHIIFDESGNIFNDPEHNITVKDDMKHILYSLLLDKFLEQPFFTKHVPLCDLK